MDNELIENGAFKTIQKQWKQKLCKNLKKLAIIWVYEMMFDNILWKLIKKYNYPFIIV